MFSEGKTAEQPINIIQQAVALSEVTVMPPLLLSPR
jgi:hypothetical protein